MLLNLSIFWSTQSIFQLVHPNPPCEFAMIVQHVLYALQAGYKCGVRYYFGIENPDGDLKHRLFMGEQQWPQGLTRAYHPFHCCAYAFKHRAKILKPMSFWTSMLDYFPAGTKGDGQCNHRECGMGIYNAITGMFNHVIKIARNPAASDGLTFRGEGAFQQNLKNTMPEAWASTEEVLTHAMQSQSERTVIDLCAGWQSMQPVCEKLGLNYITVYIKGDRNVQRAVQQLITQEE